MANPFTSEYAAQALLGQAQPATIMPSQGSRLASLLRSDSPKQSAGNSLLSTLLNPPGMPGIGSPGLLGSLLSGSGSGVASGASSLMGGFLGK